MNLEDIETYLVDRIDFLRRAENTTAEELLRCMEVLAQVKQAQHLEFIASALDMLNIWGRTGVPLEHMSK